MFLIGTLKRIVRAILRRNDDRAQSQESKDRALVPAAQSNKKRRALLIGNNYPGSSCPLAGCVNDVTDVRGFLVDVKGWAAGDVDLKTEATKLTIVQSLSALALASWTQGLDVVYIHYSGHGTQVRDANGDEADGLDEAICPADFERAGMVTDDFLNGIMCRSFNPRTKVRVVFDACHSGSCLDLAFTCAGGGTKATQDRHAKRAAGDVQLLSGCRDAQTSADAAYGGRPAGALTNSLLRVLRDRPDATALQVLDGVHAGLRAESADQFPLLSSSRNPAATVEPFVP